MKLQTWPVPAPCGTLELGLGDQAAGARASLLCPGTTHQGHTHTHTRRVMVTAEQLYVHNRLIPESQDLRVPAFSAEWKTPD